MPQDIPLTGRPQFQSSRRAPQAPQVLARQESYGDSSATPDHNAVGLLKGLSQLNPAIENYFKVQDQVQMTEGSIKAAQDVQRMADPRTALSGDIQAPADAPPAYSAAYTGELRKGLANRAASEIKTETLDAYAKDSLKPDFDASSWLAERRAKAMAGVADPTAQAIIGAHFGTLEEQIRLEQGRKNAQRLQEVNTSTAAAYAAESFSGNMKPEELGAAYPLFLEKAKGLGFTAKEANQLMFQQLEHESNKLGGVPELYDVFDQKGPDGQSIRFHHPELQQHIDAAKAKAVQMREKAIDAAAEHSNAAKLMDYETRLEKDPMGVTFGEILGDLTPHGVFQTREAAASMWSKVLSAQDKKRSQMFIEQLFDAGELWRVDPKDQDRVLTSRLAPAIEALSQATRTGDPSSAAIVGHQIMQTQSRSGSTVPSDQVVRYIKTLVTNLPSAEGASPSFKTAAELYKAMSANPTYRDLYFDEKTSKILESYNSAAGNGSDPKAAYTQAYQSVSPEAQAAADAFIKTPEFSQKVAKEAASWVEGSSWLPQWLGGNGRPQNTTAVSFDLASELRSWRTRFPFAADKEAKEYAKSWVEKHYVLDTEGKAAVKIPRGFSAIAAQAAFSEFSKTVVKQQKLDQREDANWSVQYMPEGTEGYYTVVAFNGASMERITRVSLQKLIDMQTARNVLSPEENQAIGKAKQALATGSPLTLPPDLLAKARTLKAFSRDEMERYDRTTLQNYIDRLSSVPAMSFGKPSLSNLQMSRAQVDNKLTATSALSFANNNMMNADGQHTALAASLITMGEGVSLNRYQDPAKGAGANIGMGYNLNANKDTVVTDLTQSGVPSERVQDVINGKASLTQQQAERLLRVALPRYEAEVKQMAEASSPGLWTRMTPAQKAVMVDIAYQAGDPSKFKKAWGALAAGDSKTFSDETKTTYVNQAGTRVEDTRRNNLRASLLAGLGAWNATVKTFGALPSTKLQAALAGGTKN